MSGGSTAPAVTLRRAQPGDETRLSLLGSATFLDSYAQLLPAADILAHTAKQHAPEVYARWLNEPGTFCWLCEQPPGGAPVGYAVATRPDLPIEVNEGDLEIRRIYLLHRYQGGGLGRRLMQAVEQAAREAACRRLLLGVYSRNAAALDFYARQGFSEAGTRQFRVGAHDYFDYILERRL
jgi:GNAT superfamily N-acetyltransferase